MVPDETPPAPRLLAIVDFLQEAARLKDTLRSGLTAAGRRESVADHSWRLCLLACLLEDALGPVDMTRLLKLCIVHDLGEAISGDVPAPLQTGTDDRAARERRDMETLCASLPSDLRHEMLALWDDYAAGSSPEAVLAKGLDKIETMLQHLAGAAPPEFDFAFNLTYGRAQTDRHPLLRALRALGDDATRGRLDGRASPNP
jgi:putative hydrolases of HD superfamily